MDLSGAKTSTILLRYVIPQMIGLVFNSVYFIVDGIFIGQRLGTSALAAAGVAVPIVEMMIALSMFISVGAGILISAAFGRNDAAGARNVFNVSVWFSAGISAVIVAAGLLFLEPLARTLGASDAILADTMTYLGYFIAFSPFLILSFTFSTYVRNDGRPALAMWAMTIGSLSNVLLDYVFMYPLNMGIAGAALATGLGPVFSFLILMPHFLRKKGSLHFAKPQRQQGLLGKMLLSGLPAFITEFSIGFVTLLYNLAIVRAGLGEQGLASYLVIGYAALICLTAFLGAAQGVQPAASFYYGAGDMQQIRSLFRSIAVFCCALSILFYAFLALKGGVFFRIFIENDPSLLHDTAAAAKIYFLNLPFAALNLLYISFLQSTESIGESLLVSLSRTTLPVIGFLALLPLLLPQSGLWLAITCVELITLLLSHVLWARACRCKLSIPAAPCAAK